jgi:glycosyltransferase involved in cell wall biosynthesis
MSLRILMVSDHYPPFIGGAHRQTQLLSKELLKRGHSVSVATVWHKGLPAYEDDGGIAVHRFKQLRTGLPWLTEGNQQRHQPPFPDPITTVKLRQLINTFQPDVVHSYGWYSYSSAAALLGKNIPMLISGRDYGYGCPTRTLVFRNQQPCSGPEVRKCLNCSSQLFGRTRGWVAVSGVYLGRMLLKRKVRGVHSISTYVQKMIQRDLLDVAPNAENSVGTIPQVVIPSFKEDEIDERPAMDDELQKYIQLLPTGPFILFVGALRRVKGLQQLIDAYKQLDSPPPLVLIGTMEADTPREFPPGVVVLENFPHRAVMAAWERCLFGVVPSLWPEPLGSVVYEGMSKGKAMIGSTPGGHTDMIVHGETGLLVPLGNVAKLTSAMQMLTNNPDVRERFGQNGQERAKQFTAAVAVPRFEQLYYDMVRLAAVGADDRRRLRWGERP